MHSLVFCYCVKALKLESMHPNYYNFKSSVGLKFTLSFFNCDSTTDLAFE